MVDIEKEAKVLFIASFIAYLIFGLWYYLAAEAWVALVNWPYFDPVAAKIIGAFLIGFAIIYIKAYKEANEWAKIENIVLLGLIWCILGAIGMIIGHIVYNAPAGGWVNTILLIIFAIFNAHVYIEGRK